MPTVEEAAALKIQSNFKAIQNAKQIVKEKKLQKIHSLFANHELEPSLRPYFEVYEPNWPDVIQLQEANGGSIQDRVYVDTFWDMNGDGDSYKGQFLKVNIVSDRRTGNLSAFINGNDNQDSKESQPHHMVKDGLGIMHYQNESVYEGQWIMGLRNGNGRLIHRNGDCFIGEWKDD